MPTPKLRDLQCLRAVAALLVVVDHAADAMGGHGFPVEPLHSWSLFLGAQGVAIFFLISGFIMTYTAEPDDCAAPPARAGRFALRRIVRVVPLYWFFTALIAIPALIISLHRPVSINAARIAKSLVFIPYVDGGGNMTPVLPIGWTLNYEMFFYLVFTVLLFLPSRVRTAALLGALALLVGVGAFFYPILSGANPRSVGEFLTNPVLLLFGIGAALGWLRLALPRRPLPTQGLPLVAPLLLLNLGIYIGLVHRVPVPLGWSFVLWTIDLLAVAACVFGLSPQRPWLEAIGDASYSLYLVHLLPLFVTFLLWQKLSYALPLVFLVTCLVASTAAGLACYRWLERPLTRRISAWLLPKQPSPAVVPPLAASCTSPANPL
jgi:exopolysaccharide production protein ExoZ